MCQEYIRPQLCNSCKILSKEKKSLYNNLKGLNLKVSISPWAPASGLWSVAYLYAPTPSHTTRRPTHIHVNTLGCLSKLRPQSPTLQITSPWPPQGLRMCTLGTQAPQGRQTRGTLRAIWAGNFRV